jgi:hypothetical protein
MPVTVEATPPLPGLSPVAGKPLVARFDGGHLSSDGGLLALREVERRLGLADRLAACIDDPRSPERIQHALAAILRFRMLMIAAGYEDGNDADSLRHDPVFKLALDHLPDGAALRSQPTVPRLENLPDVRALLRMARAMVGLHRASFRRVPRRIVLDVDDTFDAVHGGQRCGSSTPATTSTASSRSWCSTVRAAPWPPCCGPRGGPPARGPRPLAPAGARDPRPLAQGRDPDPRR